MAMNTRLSKLVKQYEDQYWAQRILQQMAYLYELLNSKDVCTRKLDAVLAELEKSCKEEGAISKRVAMKAEADLSEFGVFAKSLELICVAHAHIDMNWQWGTDETVGVVIDTFQTMLNLMQEYPDFIFTQSQASTYEMIEKFAPSMLPEIKQRVQEGRWEVSATTWVEPDKNMTNTESQVRHILYTKQYLSKLLDLDPNTL